MQALRDAGLWERRSDPRLGLVLGYGAENILTWQCDWEKGGRGVTSFFLSRLLARA